MKRKLLIAVPLLVAVVVLAWIYRPRHESIGAAYVSGRDVFLDSSMAQVREHLETLHYGDRVDILARRNDNVKVRTAAGKIGWIDSRLLMDPDLWQRCSKLLTEAQTMPIQARGRTEVLTNLRIAPGRTEQRLYQFARNTPVEIVARAVADWSQASDEKEPSSSPRGSKKEDWFLIRGVAMRPPGGSSATGADTNATTQPGDQSVPIAGWAVARFIALDLPDPVREGMSSSNFRPVAWFVLNHVAEPSGNKPQYLAAGTRGPEGQPCDFTTLRVYTWNEKKTRYETAFIENDVCGRMPIVTGKGPKNEPEFQFHMANDVSEVRVYRLMQTVVRRIREGEPPRHAAATKKVSAK